MNYIRQHHHGSAPRDWLTTSRELKRLQQALDGLPEAARKFVRDDPGRFGMRAR